MDQQLPRDEGVGSNLARCERKISGRHLGVITWVLPGPLRVSGVKVRNTCYEEKKGGGGGLKTRLFGSPVSFFIHNMQYLKTYRNFINLFINRKISITIAFIFSNSEQCKVSSFLLLRSQYGLIRMELSPLNSYRLLDKDIRLVSRPYLSVRTARREKAICKGFALILPECRVDREYKERIRRPA